ncbi:MAG TPA: DUF3040 domain-containing protein [Pseudonocardia sp.]|jgi:hypothetical protein|nr:DUF3040 domain-containing protein [Pseudonocardia sp.]
MLSKRERRSLGEIERALASDGFSLDSHLLPLRPAPLTSRERHVYDAVISAAVVLAAVCFALADSGGLTGGWVATAFAALTLGFRLNRSSDVLVRYAERARTVVRGVDSPHE